MFNKLLGVFKSNIAEFRDFAFKGNLIQLAIAVVLGNAFGVLINSFVQNIFMPAISIPSQKIAELHRENPAATQPAAAAATAPTTAPALARGPLFHLEINLGGTPPARQPAAEAPASAPPAAPANSPQQLGQEMLGAGYLRWQFAGIKFGVFLGDLLSFVIVALSIFLLMVKMISWISKLTHKAQPPAGPSEPTEKECPYCLMKVPYKARKCGHCTSNLVDSPSLSPTA